MLDEKGYRYLWHILKKKNLESVLLHKMLYNEHDRFNHRIQAEGAYSITTFNFDKKWSIEPGQYPGLYMSLTDELPKIEKDEILLLFPTEILLLQKNWHFNLFDRNGTFGYDTYTYENIEDIPNIKDVKSFYKNNNNRKYKYNNEVVFHHSVDMRNCQFVYDGKDLKPISEFGIKHTIIINNNPGLFLYYSDRWYTGMDVPYYSRPEENQTSVEFYKEYCKKYLYNNDNDNDNLKIQIDQQKDKKGVENVIEPYLIEIF